MFKQLREKLRRDEEKNDLEFKQFDAVQKVEPVVHPVTEARVTPAQNETRSNGVELKVIRPESFGEVSTVADNLLSGCTVVLNVEVLDRSTIYRMLDFLNGVTYCTDGEIKRVAPSTFIITPHSDVDISDM